MEKRPTDGYIWIGTGVRYLTDCSMGYRVLGNDYVEGNIKGLLNLLEEYDMLVTARVAEKLTRMRDGWLAELAEAKAADSDTDFETSRVLTGDESTELSMAAREVQITLLAEARGQVAFITRDKRFAVDKLLEDVGKLMPAGVFAGLKEDAKYDFSQAGRCIAFEVPTAAGFHLMRGTEAVLRDFYRRIVRRDRVDPLMWGPITAHLRKRRDTPDEVLMNNLDNLRRSFRNPTQHPEKIYDIDEAQDLMALSFDVVVRMQRHLSASGK
jgi:hypothetical protein